MKHTKEKNFINFTNNEGKTYKFDINTGLLYGLKGNPIKTTPSGLTSYIEESKIDSSVLAVLFHAHYWKSAKYFDMSAQVENLMFADKCDAIGYHFEQHQFYFNMLDDENGKFAKEHFKDFAKWYKENKENNTLFGNPIEQYSKECEKKDFRKNLGIEIDDHFTEYMFDTLYNYRGEYSLNECRLMAYYMSRGVCSYDEWNERDTWSTERETFGRFTRFFQYSRAIGHTPEKSDFFKQYIAVKGTYFANKKSYDAKAIKVQLDRHAKAWNFENDNYMVVVPQNVEDFKEEANQQNNCVYRMYMSRVIEGSTNVVFIRKKDTPSKSYITCEVDNYGVIRQFLLRNNNSVRSEKDVALLHEFTAHIKKVWNED